jgi:hypothetical protein
MLFLPAEDGRPTHLTQSHAIGKKRRLLIADKQIQLDPLRVSRESMHKALKMIAK